MKSAFYSGTVRHRRFSPKKHDFRYSVFMMYLCLTEIDQVFAKSILWSRKPWAVARYKRKDFHGDPAIELSEAVKQSVEKAIGRRPAGEVFMLANLRYFGFNMNPLVTYYCFDKDNRYVEAILAEVTNTPWKERRAYVLDCSPDRSTQICTFDKDFTVSPFNVSNMEYTWYSSAPKQKLSLHIDCSLNSKKITDATLMLRREEISAASLNLILFRFPFMTVKVFISIYWQALRLLAKGVPFLGKNKTSVNIKKSELEGYEVH